jgi:hypothetical protein
MTDRLICFQPGAGKNAGPPALPAFRIERDQSECIFTS